MSKKNFKSQARLKRKKRIRKKIFGTPEKPRLTVFRSSKQIYAQIINDVDGQTLVSASSLDKKVKEQPGFENKASVAHFIGKLIAERAIEKGLKQVVFDRNGFLYHGRVREVSNGAREAGLKL